MKVTWILSALFVATAMAIPAEAIENENEIEEQSVPEVNNPLEIEVNSIIN